MGVRGCGAGAHVGVGAAVVARGSGGAEVGVGVAGGSVGIVVAVGVARGSVGIIVGVGVAGGSVGIIVAVGAVVRVGVVRGSVGAARWVGVAWVGHGGAVGTPPSLGRKVRWTYGTAAVAAKAPVTARAAPLATAVRRTC
ncbi:MAG TPA: hypothetical protein VE287_05920 [Actinopolymorphaceae bacterium]|nr:hypothetical protein [Actinopolymorphaceae bacterium]